MTDISRGPLTFIREEWDDTFPFGCEYSYSAWTPVGTLYDLWWGRGPVSDDADNRIRYGRDGHPALSMSAHKALLALYGEPGSGAHWSASYRFIDRNGGEATDDLTEEQSLEDAMKACVFHYRRLLAEAMAEDWTSANG